MKLGGSNPFHADSDCSNVTSRHQNCLNQALVHQVHQPAGLTPGRVPLLPQLSGHQHQSYIHPGLPPQTREPWQDLLKVSSHTGLRGPQIPDDFSDAATQSSSDRSSKYQLPAVSYPESRRMSELVRQGLIDKRNTETVQRIRVQPQRRVILPGQHLNSRVTEPGNVFPSWQTQYSASAKQKSVQSGGLTSNHREESPQKTIVLKPKAGTTLRGCGLSSIQTFCAELFTKLNL